MAMLRSRLLWALVASVCLLLLCGAIGASAAGDRRSRAGALIGYTERSNAVKHPCVDELGEAVCTSYKNSRMCQTGEMPG